MFILLAGCSKQCRECWNVLLIFDFKNYFAWFWANNGIVRNESHDIFSWIYTANCFIMTIFLPFFAYFVICEVTGQVRFFNKGFNRKKNAAKLQNCFTTLNSRFYPEIFFQSMKKVSPPVFYRVCTMVWHVYWVRHVYCTWHCFKHWTPKHATHLQRHVNAVWVVVIAVATQKMNMWKFTVSYRILMENKDG